MSATFAAATATTFKWAPRTPTKAPSHDPSGPKWCTGNPSIIKNAICTNKFEWERIGAAAVAAAVETLTG